MRFDSLGNLDYVGIKMEQYKTNKFYNAVTETFKDIRDTTALLMMYNDILTVVNVMEVGSCVLKSFYIV